VSHEQQRSLAGMFEHRAARTLRSVRAVPKAPTCVLRFVLESQQQHEASHQAKGTRRHHAPLPAVCLAQEAWWHTHARAM
jgi:hypothetical protein